MEMIIETNSVEETYNLGKKTGEGAKSGEVYLLSGDLGAGKTSFSKGFAKGLGINEDVTSPTFTIMCVYESGRLPLYHFDAYRISDESEIEEIGAEEFIYGKGVCLIEWPEKIKGVLPSEAIEIKIEKAPEKGSDYRSITIKK